MSLSTVHRQLVDALSHLDRKGQYAASAHLVAAIELLEDAIDLHPGDCLDSKADSVVTTLAKRMVEELGDRATTVARNQLADATGPATLAWAAIVNCIDR